MNRGGIADLSLLRTLLAICQKSRERRFWEVIDSFVLSAYASLVALWTLLQRLLVYLIVKTKKNNFFELWQQHKQLKTMEMSVAWPDTNQDEIHHKLYNETGIPCWVWGNVSGNWDNNMIRISPWRESHCRTNASIRRWHKSKRAGLRES